MSTEDMSVRRASTNLPTTDMPNSVYHPPTSLSELKDRCPTCFDMSLDIDHQENDKDTSSRCVPSSFLSLAAACQMSYYDVCHLSIGCGCVKTRLRSICRRTWANTPTYNVLTCYVVSSGVDYHRDHEESVETSIRRSLSSPQPPRTHRHRMTTSVTSTSTKDVSRHVNSLSDGSYGSTHPSLRHSNVPLDVNQQATSIRCVPLTSDGSPKSDIQDDWEERIKLICMEYGMMKPHDQAQYRKRAIKIVDEFAGNDPEMVVKGSSKYYDTIVKMFTCLATKYR